jgi:glutaredoxin
MRWFSDLLILALPVFACASELQYFDRKIDFWGTQQESPAKAVAGPRKESTKKEPFPWETYTNPQNKEFFQEGNYTPPEPFMEIARNPTDENIKHWFEFMKKKNEMAARLQQRMAEYMAKSQASGLPAAPSIPTPRNEATPAPFKVAVETSRFRFRMYFDSHCPHCRRMFGVLKRLADEGYKVEVIQVDRDPLPNEEKIIPLAHPPGPAGLDELKQHGGSAVPYLVIADLKRKALLPGVQGYHDYDDVMTLLRAASRN